ncbi:hypothetical protein J4558_16160 [Leptolyngbya sp. 15MV]|nr:hypothetical protein J4558_16160 [Leptolyngbya sp. 15MV]
MVNDPFAGIADTPTSPARQAYPVVPHDEHALPRLPKALLVGGAGDLVVRAIDSAADTRLTVEIPSGPGNISG